MGHTYVMSDIHGMGSLLEEMLDKIAFSRSDHLYILGDMIDRGTEPVKVLDLVMSSRNITALRGNHEDSFVDWYENEADKRKNRYYYNTWDILTDSLKTMEKLPDYVNFMRRLPLYKKLKMNGNCYLMAHASTEGILQMWKRKNMFLWDSSMVDRGGHSRVYFHCGACAYPDHQRRAQKSGRHMACSRWQAHRRGLRSCFWRYGRTSGMPLPGHWRGILCAGYGKTGPGMTGPG